jgi:uncharacterized membrane protein YeaQ/YmgE (transglycosylase-associated protein family)
LLESDGTLVRITAIGAAEKRQLSRAAVVFGGQENFEWCSAIHSAIAQRKVRSRSKKKVMLHLIWYLLVGFLAGCVAKALMHTHLSLIWTIVLGIVGSIIGGAVTHLFYPPNAGGRFHLGGIIVSIAGAIVVLYVWHKFRLHIPRG